MRVVGRSTGSSGEGRGVVVLRGYAGKARDWGWVFVVSASVLPAHPGEGGVELRHGGVECGVWRRGNVCPEIER